MLDHVHHVGSVVDEPLGALRELGQLAHRFGSDGRDREQRHEADQRVRPQRLHAPVIKVQDVVVETVLVVP